MPGTGSCRTVHDRSGSAGAPGAESAPQSHWAEAEKVATYLNRNESNARRILHGKGFTRNCAESREMPPINFLRGLTEHYTKARMRCNRCFVS
jgi:hypothetical protein